MGSGGQSGSQKDLLTGYTIPDAQITRNIQLNGHSVNTGASQLKPISKLQIS